MDFLKDTAFIVCSRSNSKRIPNKPFQRINGVTLIKHLLNRLVDTKIKVILAVPYRDLKRYQHLDSDKVSLFGGSDSDPLARMYEAAKAHNVKNIIRVCHDKIFIDPNLVKNMLDIFRLKNLDYIFSSKFTDGSGFEVISFSALEEASRIYKDIEHISYAIKSITDNIFDFVPSPKYMSSCRLLIDYPEDVRAMETVLSIVGNDASLVDAIECIGQNTWIRMVNMLPLVTVYTCAYNAQRWINQCMDSVKNQDCFYRLEYILVDDFSSDMTPGLMSQFRCTFGHVKWIRNQTNLGLATSSNIALSHAKGKYIIRLDADDYFAREGSLSKLIKYIEDNDHDVVYPNHFVGSIAVVGLGSSQHHAGGAIFKRRALNHLKFTDGLRGWDSYDLFERAKNQLKIGYLNEATFMYRQHDSSMSRTNMDKRKRLKEDIDLNLGI